MRRRPFETRLEFPEEAEWRPLEGVARLTCQRDDLPSLRESEFMYSWAPSSVDEHGDLADGWYRLHRSLAHAVAHVDL